MKDEYTDSKIYFVWQMNMASLMFGDMPSWIRDYIPDWYAYDKPGFVNADFFVI